MAIHVGDGFTINTKFDMLIQQRKNMSEEHYGYHECHNQFNSCSFVADFSVCSTVRLTDHVVRRSKTKQFTFQYKRNANASELHFLPGFSANINRFPHSVLFFCLSST